MLSLEWKKRKKRRREKEEEGAEEENCRSKSELQNSNAASFLAG